MHRKHVLWAAALLALPLLGCAGKKTESEPASAPRPQFEASDTVTAQVTVLALDKPNRLATLKRDTGDTVTVEVGPEVKNFPQLEVGDVINIVYTENLSVQVEPPGTPSTTAEATATTAPLGEKPAGTVTTRTETKATITAIDKTKGIATLQTQDGNTFNVTPHDPTNLDRVSVGDLVVFTHTQVVAASVQPVKAKK
jgi:hypothetical protein